MMDVIQRLIGWWNPPPPPPTAIIVSTAPALSPTKCLPTTIPSAKPTSLNPVDAGLNLYNFTFAFYVAFTIICSIVWIRQHVRSCNTTRSFLIVMISLPSMVGLFFERLYCYLGHQQLPFERGAILATIRNDWAHAWPEAITAKSNANRLYKDLSMLFIWRIPHRIKESLGREIWTTTIYLKSPVAAIMARGFLIADLPFIVTPLCFLSACFYGIYQLNNIKRPRTRREISAQDFSDEAGAAKPLQRNWQLDQKITDLETKVQELKTSGEGLGKENADLKTRLEKSTQANAALAAINHEVLTKMEKLNADNDETADKIAKLDADNDKKADQIAEMKNLLDRYEKHTGEICELNEKAQDENSNLLEVVQELRLKNAELEVEKINWQRSLADSESGDEAGPQSRTGAEAGPSTDKAKSNVNSDSKKPEANDGKAAPPTDQPQSAKAGDDSSPPLVDKQPSAGRIEGDASDKEEGQAGPSTPKTPATNAGDDSEAFADGESTTEPNEDDTADGQAQKKRRRKKRGGMKVRAAKEAAWARANGIGAPGDEAKKADGGEATEAHEGDAE